MNSFLKTDKVLVEFTEKRRIKLPYTLLNFLSL